MSPKFSVIVPVYNVAPYLRECLDSLLAQTHEDWEAICVDDGSTDDSGNILDEYARRDSRFRIVHKKNEGVSVARNVALDLASGDWIGFLDSDDVISPDRLQVVAEITNKENVDLVRLGFRKWYGEKPYPQTDTGSRITEAPPDASWGWRLFAERGMSCQCFLKKTVLERMKDRFPVGMRLSEDTIFCLRMVPFVKRYCLMEHDGYFYRMRSASAVHARRSAKDCCRFCRELNVEWLNQKYKINPSNQEVCLRFTTRALVGCVICYMHARAKSDSMSEYRCVAECLCDCHGGGILELKFVPLRLRLAFFVTLRTRSMVPLLATYDFFDLYKKPLRFLKHRLFHKDC